MKPDPIRRHVLTGAPGAGKTVILEQLRALGFAVVPEAATDLISDWQLLGVTEPWIRPDFIDAIIRLQGERERAAPTGGVVVFDRSPLCTLALAHFVGHPVSPLLAAEVARVVDDNVFERQVFFVDVLGFMTPTAVRQISYDATVEFAERHAAVYREHGFELVHVAPGPPGERAARVASRLWP